MSCGWQVDQSVPWVLEWKRGVWNTSVCLHEDLSLYRFPCTIHWMWRTNVPWAMSGEYLANVTPYVPNMWCVRITQVTLFFFIFMFAPCIFSIKIHLLKPNWCTLLIASTLNKIKVTINTPRCFGSRRNHHQGVPQCLAKAVYMVLCTSMVT
jgi:hypothetical protein